MNIQQDPAAIIGTACRLPGGVKSLDELWPVLSDGLWSSCSTPVPRSRWNHLRSSPGGDIHRAGWLGVEGLEEFDPSFFGIPPGEAEIMRPNTRLALELTWEALENAGIPASELKGRNVSVSIAVGTEDGWDLRRFAEDGPSAFDHYWAINSEPSAVTGRVAHFFDFHGTASTTSNACAGGAFALRDGIRSLYDEDADLAVVGSVSTHLSPGAFAWAQAVGVGSRNGRCSSFSAEADGYMPSEGAVFLILKKASRARENCNVVDGLIRSVALGHGGRTRNMTTPNVSAQCEVALRALKNAHMSPDEITFLEAHGTGTVLGDMLEMEAIEKIYRNLRDPVFVSSAKTVVGHCQAAASLVGILKTILCFKRRIIPPHHVTPKPAYTSGQVIVSTEAVDIRSKERVAAVVTSLGFTGSIASIILEEDFCPIRCPTTPPSKLEHQFIIPFSAKSEPALSAQIRDVVTWARKAKCDLHELGSALALSREHHPIRRAFVVEKLEDLAGVSLQSERTGDSTWIDQYPNASLQLLNLDSAKEMTIADGIKRLLDSGRILEAAAALFESGHSLDFTSVYDRESISPTLLRSLPTYPFQRNRWWRNPVTFSFAHAQNAGDKPIYESLGLGSQHSVAEIVAGILHVPEGNLDVTSSIFDMGINSINSIELAQSLSRQYGVHLNPGTLYQLLTIESITEALVGDPVHKGCGSRLPGTTQSDIDTLIDKFGAPFPKPSGVKIDSGSKPNILLTGVTGNVGSSLLGRLLEIPEVTVFCLVRGTPWTRLKESFAKRRLDVSSIQVARENGSLIPLHTSDLAHLKLGCSDEDYDTLLSSVSIVIHAAWKVDFNIPLGGFHGCLTMTRNVAEFCTSAKKRICFHFLTTVGSVLRFDGPMVPESPLEPKVQYALPQGYAISKLVAEHVLYRIFESCDGAFSLHVSRIGHICGDSSTGFWAPEEIFPMMIASIPALKMMPRHMPDVSWIPSDICADVLRDLVLNSREVLEINMHNIVNPQIISWEETVDQVSQALSHEPVPLVSLQQYTKALKTVNPSPPISPLLPYLETCARQEEAGERFCPLEVTDTVALSPSLRCCPPINASLLKLLVKAIVDTFSPKPSPIVLIFGPWSSKSPPIRTTRTSVMRFVAEIQEYASLISGRPVDLSLQEPLEKQLATLAEQLSFVSDLEEKGYKPVAVTGYCFGEFAASVTSGALTVETAVGIIVRRAAALQGTSGAMLNVFADISVLRAKLVLLENLPEIAIFAGPRHFVLAGSLDSIQAAQNTLTRASIKVLPVSTPIPFHSKEVETAAISFKIPEYHCQPPRCEYISGITGTKIETFNLGPTYWRRHMREPVKFYSAMETVRKDYGDAKVVDIGPDPGVRGIITRYGWEDLEVLSVKDFLNEDPPPLQTNQRTSPPLPPPETPRGLPANASVPLPIQPTTTLDPPSCGVLDLQTTAVDLLKTMFAYDTTEDDILHESFATLGLDSLQFVMFAERFQEMTGKTLAASTYTSNNDLADILRDLV